MKIQNTNPGAVTTSPETNPTLKTPLDFSKMTPSELAKLDPAAIPKNQMGDFLEALEAANEKVEKQLKEVLERNNPKLEQEEAPEPILESTPRTRSLDLTHLELVKDSLKLEGSSTPKTELALRPPTDTVAGIYTGSNFDSWILPELSTNTETITESLSIHKLKQNITALATDIAITMDYGSINSITKEFVPNENNKPFTKQEAINILSLCILKQKDITNTLDTDGKIISATPNSPEPLVIDGNCNIFIIHDYIDAADKLANKMSCFALYANWGADSRMWRLRAGGEAGGWAAGNRVISRN